MGHKTFIGGVHPYDGKELSKDSPIKEVFAQGRHGISGFAAYRRTG